MPQPPLSDAMVATLRTDPCAALAAIMVVASAHAELMAWAQRTLSPPAVPHETPGANSANEARLEGRRLKLSPDDGSGLKPRKVAKLNGGHAAYHDRLRAKRDTDDERLIEAMKQAPEASVREWGRAIGKCRTATVQALHRLRDAGLIESEEGAWALVEASTNAQPQPAAPRWLEPLSGARVAKHSADGRVRGELTMAPSPA